MKRWLKYGLIGAVVGILVLIGAYLSGLVGNSFMRIIFGSLAFPFLLVMIVVSSILGCDAIYGSCPFQMILGLIVSIGIMFGIGALIGLIVDKIKVKRK